jgi:prepilin-type N-terminal cleavage/methylation domain-containing protein
MPHYLYSRLIHHCRNNAILLVNHLFVFRNIVQMSRPHEHHKIQRAAFTLVELAVVLVIIGLVVGGVLVGRDLIHQSELQAIINERNKIYAALYTFRTKYGTLAGDMSNAHQYFGDDCGTNTADFSTGCNGNGNGQINQILGETIKVWEHLSLAGLMAGDFDGTAVLEVSVGPQLSGENIPKAGFGDLYWNITNDPANAVFDPPSAALSVAFYLRLGTIDPGWATSNGSSGLFGSAALSHGDALRIDTKTDDGFANSGVVRGDSTDSCMDVGADAYSVTARGEDYVGDCILTFIP